MVESSDVVTDITTMIAKLTTVTKSSFENVFLRDHRGLRDHRMSPSVTTVRRPK
jgi:hypothetical protein